MIRTALVVVILGLAVVGIMGYTMEDEAPAQPLRFVYEAKTGSVVFDHKYHVAADGAAFECSHCHHLGAFLGFENDNGSVEFDHKSHGLSEHIGLECNECHHLSARLPFSSSEGRVVFEHDTHGTSEDYDLGCDDCHHAREEDKPIQSCNACHSPGSENNEFVDEDAVHKTAVGVKCMECHEELLEDADGCAICHDHDHLTITERYPSCESCHGEGSKNNRFFQDGFHEGAVGAQCAACHKDKVDDDEEGCGFCHGDQEKKQDQKAISCNECHSEGSKYNKHLSLAPLVHKSAIGAQCDSCHADKMAAKDCAFCHKN